MAQAKKKTTKATPKSDKKAPTAKNDNSALFDITYSANKAVWKVSTKVYPMDVIYQTAFVFIDRAYLLLDKGENGQVAVMLKGKEKLNKAELEALSGEFANELLNQAVRRQLAKQNHRLRELIVAKALFAASRPGELREIMGNVSNATGVAGEQVRPWDEATQEEQDELDRLLAEIEQDFADDPMGIAVPWDEKYGDGKAADAPEGGEKKDEK